MCLEAGGRSLETFGHEILQVTGLINVPLVSWELNHLHTNVLITLCYTTHYLFDVSLNSFNMFHVVDNCHVDFTIIGETMG